MLNIGLFFIMILVSTVLIIAGIIALVFLIDLTIRVIERTHDIFSRFINEHKAKKNCKHITFYKL